MIKDKILKIISGGQTGADVAGLIAAKNCGIKTGGCAPKGYRTENGRNSDLIRLFDLHESTSSKYPPRTAENVGKSDATLIFSNGDSRGSKLTKNLCIEKKKKFLFLDPFIFSDEEIVNFINSLSKEKGRKIILNIAGNRESVTPGIEELVRTNLERAFNEMD